MLKIKQICLLLLIITLISGRENPIKKVIVLVMENHSYDNMLGWMNSPIGDLTGEEYNLLDPSNPSSQKFYAQRGSPFSTQPDPPHDFIAVNRGEYGTMKFPADSSKIPNMSGFAWRYSKYFGDPQKVLDQYTPEQVPIISTLADNFKVMNRWFSSVPACTDPNKMFFHAATSNGNTGNCLDWYCAGYPMIAQTIYNSLENDGKSWQINWMDWCEAMAIYPVNQNVSNFVHDQGFLQFFEQLHNGSLPDYTFLVPRLRQDSADQKANTQHPSEDIRNGEYLMKQVYENLRNSSYWLESLLLVTYDEHGGFWDKISPPGNVPNPTPQFKSFPNRFDFTRLGVRVPAIAISPWIAQGLDSKQYDHSSVPATIKSIFNLSSDYLTLRDKNVNHFIQPQEILEFPRNTIEILPNVPRTEVFKKIDVDLDNQDSNKKVEGSDLNQVYLLASRLLKEKQIPAYVLEGIISKIKTPTDSGLFCKEALTLLGYHLKETVQFKFLNEYIFQKGDYQNKIISE